MCILLGMPPADLGAGTGRRTNSDGAHRGGHRDSRRTVAPPSRTCAAPNAWPPRKASRSASPRPSLYPVFFINGTLGYAGRELAAACSPAPRFTGNIGPAFQWNILNYGRIRNNMRLQDARFWALVASLPEHGAAGQRRSRGRTGGVPPRPGARQAARQQRGQRRNRRSTSSSRSIRRGSRLQPRGADRAEPGPAARPAGPVARRDRPGIDPGVPGTGRRLASLAGCDDHG